jgi:hypothetical protein
MNAKKQSLKNRLNFYLTVCIFTTLTLSASTGIENTNGTGTTPNNKSVQEQAINGESHRNFTRDMASLEVSAPSFVTTNSTDFVPWKWITEAVRQAASERWTNFAVGQPIPCCNLAGQLICYQVPVVIGTNRFPNILTAPPATEVSLDDLHTPQLWAVSDFWTFDVAAQRSYYPIPHYGPGLPPFLVTYHKAAELAQQKLASTRITIGHYYALAPTEQYYEFVSPSGSNVVINARTLHISDSPIGVSRPDARSTAVSTNLEIKQKIENLKHEHEREAQEAWDRITNNVESH